ncbi:MAG: cobalamin-dependent protein [Acetobacteraceae bacterium]|nr:cobalamin-dependent protein [Acetobacteraceae bacterium]
MGLVGIYPYSPVGLAPATLKAYCDATPSLSGVSVEIVGFLVDAPAAEVADALGTLGYDVVGFSTYVWNAGLVLEAARRLKALAPGAAVVLGGPEVAGWSRELLSAHPSVDFVVAGEGELTLAELLACLQKAGEGDGYAGVRGLAYRSGGGPAVNPPRPLIEDLGSLPSPFLAGVLDVDRVGPYLFALETYRGCPFGCRYCFWGKHRRVRYFPLERVEAELRLILKSSNLRRVFFSDSVCNLDLGRFKRVLRLLADENPNGIIFDFEMIPDKLDEETLGLLGRLRDGYVAFGLQSTTPAALEQIGRRWRKAALERGVRALRASAGRLKLYIDLIYGLPGDTYRGYLESIRYAMSLLPDKVQPHPLQVLPGSEFWTDPGRYGLEFQREAPHLVERSSTFSAGEVRRAAAWTTPLYVYFNPAVRAAVALLTARPGAVPEDPFRLFVRLLRCLRRVVDLYLVAREVDVDAAAASRLGAVLDAFLRGELRSRGVPAEAATAIRDAVRFYVLCTTMASVPPDWQPPAGLVPLRPGDVVAVSPSCPVATFDFDVTALDGLSPAADPRRSDALPRRPTTVAFNRRLNQPQRLSPALAELVALCDGSRTAGEVASEFAARHGFVVLEVVVPRLLEALGDLVNQGVLDVVAKGAREAAS